MAESHSSAVPMLPGLAVETVEWLPSGAESGLVRVRGRWTDEAARQTELPGLALRASGTEHRFESLPDARFSRDPSSWRGTYLVPAELVAAEPDALWLEWAGGARSGLPALARGLEPPPVPGAARPAEAEEPGGQVIDRAVLAERRARRAEAAERRQARVAAEALKAVEVLELRSAELERRLEEATAERDALMLRESEADERRGALSAALASAAALRSRSREWQLHMRTSEVSRAGDAVRLAVLEAERASTAPALRAALDEANAAAVSARSALEETDGRFGEARAAWDRRRSELEAELAQVRAELDRAREEAEAGLARLESDVTAAEGRADGAEARLRVEEVARSALEDELDRERAARANERTAASDLRRELELARADAAEADDLRAELDAVRGDATALDGLRAELADARSGQAAADNLRADLEAARAALDGLQAELEAERAARRAAEQRLTETEGSLQQRIAELEASGRDQLERLAAEQAAAAAAREPADASQLVADLEAAADALRQRVAPDADAAVDPIAWPDASPVVAGAEPVGLRPEAVAAESWTPAAPAAEPAAPDAEPAVEWSAPGGEPAAPDAEPAVEWQETVESAPGEVTPGVEPRRDGAAATDVEWAAPYTGDEAAVEPPAPDAEPYVEWAPPEVTPSPLVVAAPAETSPVPDVAPIPAGPKIIPAANPPARGLMLGTDRRDYPLLRGALVKLAHDDPALAGRLLAALLPAQGTAIEGPLSYDLTIRGTGTYGIAIAAGRAGVEELDAPRGRRDADFHLTADPLILAELLAGVDHRIGRFFGPARVRGRKRHVKALRPLQTSSATFTDAARAGASLDPELVYRTFAYAVHPSWTRGHEFTVAQEIEGDPAETWYLTARDGAGLTVSATAPDGPPEATVSMSRATFARLLRGETVPPGQRPCVHGDGAAVELMVEWTQRARANA